MAACQVFVSAVSEERKIAGVMSEGSTASYQHHGVGAKPVMCRPLGDIQVIGTTEGSLQVSGPSSWILASKRETKG